MLVSIIIPVYNAERFIIKCIESIISQTFKDWELLLINDGSTDNSGNICEEYARKDSRIFVFQKENEGVSRARNLGLNESKGQWVMFVDADDWITEDCLAQCVYNLKKYDLDAFQFGCTLVYPTKQFKVVKKQTEVLSGEQYVKNGVFNVCVGGGIYRHSVIKEHNLRFVNDLKLAEDQVFILSFFRYCNRIKYENKAYYYYLQNPSSAVHNPQSKDILNSCEYLINFSKEVPMVKPLIDSDILRFIIELIKNADVPYLTIKKLYEKQEVNEPMYDSTLQNLFFRIAKINFRLSYLIAIIGRFVMNLNK